MKLLKINLTNRVVSEKEIKKEFFDDWIGGRGLGAYLYSQDIRQPDDPLNSIFLMTGAVTGTALPSSSRLEVVSSSPLTNYYQASSVGGYFGAYLRSQGVIGLQIVGQASDWIYLIVKNGRVKIKDAKDLVGLNVYKLREKLDSGDNRSVLSIGRAGENLVRFASLQFDNRAAGRTGTGWHFGFKKLKAVVVHKDKFPIEIKDDETMRRLIEELAKKKKDHEKKEDVTSYCTPLFTDYASENYVYPVGNYRRTSLNDEELEKIGYIKFQEKVVEKEACWACPLACTRITKSRFSDQGVKGPEYETIWALGANPENFDMDVLIEATRLCDDYGLDTISTGAVLAWYKECCEKGLVSDSWNAERFLELIRKIGEREDIGDVLAEGSSRASKEFKGSDKFLVHAKGLELPAWDPRGAWGMAVCYATAPTGGDHCKGWTVSGDIGDSKTRFSDLERKVKNAIEKQNFSVILDSSGFCMFADFMLDYEMFARCFNAVLGTNLTAEKLKKRSKAIFDLERKINQKLGHTLAENILPERIIDYEIEVSGKKEKLSKENFEGMLEIYYKIRDWE